MGSSFSNLYSALTGQYNAEVDGEIASMTPGKQSSTNTLGFECVVWEPLRTHLIQEQRFWNGDEHQSSSNINARNIRRCDKNRGLRRLVKERPGKDKMQLFKVTSSDFDRFVKRMIGGCGDTYGNIAALPFSLLIEPSDLCALENRKRIFSNLSKIGSSLVELKLSVGPVKVGMFEAASTNFSLSNLKKVTVFPSEPNGNYKDDEIMCFYCILQGFLNAARNLKYLSFESSSYLLPGSIGSYFGTNFAQLLVPSGLTHLHFHHPLYEGENERYGLAEFFKLNSFQNLTSLRLSKFITPFTTLMIFQILKRFQNTLEELYLNGSYLLGHSTHPHHFCRVRFPLMPKLRALEVTTPFWQLERGTSNLERQLPNLEHFKLEAAFQLDFQELIGRSIYPSVHTASFFLITGEAANFNSLDEPQAVPLTGDVVQLLLEKFPNLLHLELVIACSLETSGLRTIFRELTKLQSLKLEVQNNYSETGFQSFWDAVLIGADCDNISKYQQNPELLESSPGSRDDKDNNDVDAVPSIRNLTELIILSLSGDYYDDCRTPLLSDAAFQFGFLRTPKLRQLELRKGFWPSEKMVDMWNAIPGASIKYYPY